MSNLKLINDDCLNAMKELEEGSVDSLVTDPPAGISFMSMDWDKNLGGRDNWVDHMSNIFKDCLRVMKPGAHGFVWAIPRTSHWTSTALENAGFELVWSKNKHKREIARFNNTLFSGELDARNKVHPTQKPIKLIKWFFERYKGQNVVDLFLGSGSTLIACEKTKRKCYGMEIDPHYCDVIIKRWEDFTGLKAKKIND